MWDYGGILRFYDESGTDSRSIFPNSNRLLIRNENRKLFHDVSIQSEYAKHPQFLVLGWAAESMPDNPKYSYKTIE
jgi:hypothetical protein